MNTRRTFLKNASLAAGILILPTGCRTGEKAPSNRVNLACVGVGGMGRWDVPGFAAAGATIVGLCDVSTDALAKAQAKFPTAQPFADYREMLDKLDKDIDAVSVSIPDHAHFTVAHSAVELGKHVYVQKPMCHTIDQVRRLSKLAAAKKVVTQMGNQGQSSGHIRKAKEWYDAGLIGDVSLVDVWSDRPGWPQGMDTYRPTEKVPENLNWDLWLGPVSKRPYSPGLAPNNWRGYYEFGCGALGDMAIHLMNDAFYVLDLTAPTKIEVEAEGAGKVSYPTRSIITYHFPANGARGPVKVVWRDGKLKPPVPEHATELPSNGSLLHGKNFTLSLCGWSDTFTPLVPDEQNNALKAKAPPEKYPRIKGGHYRNWVNAIRSGTKATSDFATSGPFAEVILLGVIAQRLGRTLNWDAKAGQFIGDAEANSLVKAPPPRAGFKA
ncbi:MAG: Gfo/Idh/MocA family oxidoreductase [Puniceicoccales bacterium]|jgi:predicted dehydrogenase|nr:Gfo/Idh/MocA family oxidoreductase [Puniceicoccales bacterium]